MPRIDDQFLDCVIYLYASEEDASNGFRSGGTGFIISVPFTSDPTYSHFYAVTNSHVIREANSTVIRFNKLDGTVGILNTNAEKWIHHPDGDDIAIYHFIPSLNPLVVKYMHFSPNIFLTDEIIENQDIGVGEDVFMVGRFINHDGKQTNLPSVRFGNISMMPYEKVYHPRGFSVESFVVETRSLSGNSGSPVFVFINPNIPRGLTPQNTLTPGSTMQIWLLGVDWGHSALSERVLQSDGKTWTDEGFVVPSNSGQMFVSPAWKLKEILDLDECNAARADLEKALATEL